MTHKKYYAALIGTGRIGFSLGFDKKREQPASHTMALLAENRISLLAAADTDGQRLSEWQKFAKKNGSMALTFPSSEELYKNVTCLDIITVAVNEQNHLSECLKAIEYEPKLVILEKPVALNMAEAEKIREAAREHNVPVMVNHERRFAKDYLCALSLLDQIGEIQSIRAELDSGLRVYSAEHEKDGAYSLLHDGTHLVDIVQFILAFVGQENRDGRTQLSTPILKNPTITGIYKDEQGCVRNVSAHYSTDAVPDITLKMSGRSRFFEFAVEILGTLGKIRIGNGCAELYLRKESSLYTGFYSLAQARVRFPKKTCYFSGMVQNAVDFLDGKTELVSPLDDAISDLAVLEEIKETF